MNKTFKTVLLWLLLFAFPLQGFAASAMLFCKMSHHHTATMQVSSSDQHDHVAHQHELSTTVSNHSHHSADSADSASPHHDTAKCSACAACCVGAAIAPSLANILPSQAPDSHPNPFSIAHFAGHIPTGLERPPRFILV